MAPEKPAQPAAPAGQQNQQRTGRRLVAAALLIGASLAGLVVVDRLREHASDPPPPHEPSQALITSPAPAQPSVAVIPEPQRISPPPPPKVLNNEILAPPPQATAPTRPEEIPPADKLPTPAGKPYMVQVGVFTSPANAQALQKQLKRAGINAHLETRVQLGPFKDKRDADAALAKARKLGINAVLIGPR